MIFGANIGTIMGNAPHLWIRRGRSNHNSNSVCFSMLASTVLVSPVGPNNYSPVHFSKVASTVLVSRAGRSNTVSACAFPFSRFVLRFFALPPPVQQRVMYCVFVFCSFRAAVVRSPAAGPQSAYAHCLTGEPRRGRLTGADHRTSGPGGPPAQAQPFPTPGAGPGAGARHWDGP